jgi:urease accessory protein
MTDEIALLRLLQLASPALPVGAYTYSQGLEWAVASGEISDEVTALAWIGGVLEHGVGLLEAPLLARQQVAWLDGNTAEVWRLNAEFIATRETAELRAETVQMGYSLRRLAGSLPELTDLSALDAVEEVAFPTVWAALAATWAIPLRSALVAYLWSWCENQTMAAIKTVPLGQSSGQRILFTLGGRIPLVAARALELGEDAWSNFAPGLAISSCRHETLYYRLFRS